MVIMGKLNCPDFKNGLFSNEKELAIFRLFNKPKFSIEKN